MYNDRNQFPIWLGGVLLALVLILVGTRVSGMRNPTLEQQFAPRPTDPNAPTSEPLHLPQLPQVSLPPDVQKTFDSLRSRFSGGEAIPALTPSAQGVRVRVEVQHVQRTSEQTQVNGTVTNISDAPLTIPAGAFSFRDSAGLLYAVEGNASTTLQPGASVPLSLNVPLPPDRGLTLILTLPPDPPLQQTLVPSAS